MHFQRRHHTTGKCTAIWIAAGLTWGCSDSDPNPFDDFDVVGSDTNRDGYAYPTDDIGMRPRNGTTPGQRLPNMSFRGYLDGRKEDGLQIASFADYYDPTQSRSDLFIIVAVSLYCPHCQAQTRAMVALEDWFDDAKVRVVEVAIEGAENNRPLALADVDDWLNKMGMSFTVLIDAEARRIREYATIHYVPWNVRVDPRSMEVLSIEQGEIGNFRLYAQQGLDWVASHEPRR